MLARRHLRQRHLFLAPEVFGGIGEERQALGRRCRIERAHLPQRRAAIEADGAEGIRLGKPLQGGARDAGAQPEIANAPIWLFARGHEECGVRLAQPLDLAQAEPHGVTRADRPGLFLVAGVECGPARGGGFLPASNPSRKN